MPRARGSGHSTGGRELKFQDTTGTQTWDDYVVALREVLTEIMGAEPPALHANSHLQDDLGLDSFEVLLLFEELEGRLHLRATLSEDEPTVGNVFRLLSTEGAPTDGG